MQFSKNTFDGEDIHFSAAVDTKPVHVIHTIRANSKRIRVQRRVAGSKSNISVKGQYTTAWHKLPDHTVLYNRKMGGTDKQDQLVGTYTIAQNVKTRGKWQLRLVFQAFDMALLNSYILYKVTATRQQQKVMERTQFLKSIIEDWTIEKKDSLHGDDMSADDADNAVESVQSDVKYHTPLTFPRGERGGGGENTDMRRRCAHCGSPGGEILVGTKIFKRKGNCSTMCKE